jgi:uncharacterized phage-associated protein
LYYSQAWHLAFYEKPLFDGAFEAWIHGPVHRGIYDRFKASKGLYSEISTRNIPKNSAFNALPDKVKEHIDEVLDAYAGLDGVQLEKLTHEERPWIEARMGYRPTDRCEVAIEHQIMIDYYKSKLDN